MTNKTQTLEHFSIYQDGELVQEPLAIKAAQVAGNLAMTALQAAGRSVVRTVGECATNVRLDAHDARYGTTLRKEYLEEKRALATAALRGEVGL